MYLLYKESPTYVAIQKNGLNKFWKISILTDAEGKFYTQTHSWQQLKDGGTSIPLVSEPFEVTPKNIGKANETTAAQQAVSEYNSIIQTQRDKKQYLLPGESRVDLQPLPMLAHSFDKQSKKIVYPAYVQIKYDGHRMLYSTALGGMTRGGKQHIPEVIQHLTFDTEGLCFDGELLLPGTELLQKSASAVKKYQKGLSDQLQYVIYDIVDATQTYKQRYERLKEFFATRTLPDNVLLAETHIVQSAAEVETFFKKAVAQGFEGVMIRNMNGKYTIKDRSYDLQKYKPFFEEEFEIVDVVPMGGGNATDLGKFILRSSTGVLFASVYQADFEARKELLIAGKAEYKGKYAQCRYPYLSEAGVPQHSRVVDIRETKESGF
jgi:DNA ligase-1